MRNRIWEIPRKKRRAALSNAAENSSGRGVPAMFAWCRRHRRMTSSLGDGGAHKHVRRKTCCTKLPDVTVSFSHWKNNSFASAQHFGFSSSVTLHSTQYTTKY
ncbi:hypothetical protein CDAR_396171 [Caerostris darwini]|uniref:Uncharacterized protein n=1 Tax=Caerostris darwini TaxID=1538125 RepID=A0AAV4WP19_9ARAC|nr:hypothetical protein CDAR_396171 [Caerostris darwini]